MSEELIGEELTLEQMEADAKMVEAGMGSIYAPMLEEKRKKAAKKSGHRRKTDRRFKVNALDDVAPPTVKSRDEPWDCQPEDALDEKVRISRLVFPYLVPGAGVDTFRTGINKGELILKILDGRAQSINNLMRLYAFTRRRYKNGGRPLHGPIVELIESILVKEGVIEQPGPEQMSATFGNIFEGIPSVVGKAKI
jgi:hypothetical protein